MPQCFGAVRGAQRQIDTAMDASLAAEGDEQRARSAQPEGRAQSHEHDAGDAVPVRSLPRPASAVPAASGCLVLTRLLDASVVHRA